MTIRSNKMKHKILYLINNDRFNMISTSKDKRRLDQVNNMFLINKYLSEFI